jgi:hypothetical protein
MKRFLIGAGAKVGRFFWSWGFLKFVLWTITLIVFLYVEEDWRGARAWAATKAKWEAKGETFDLNRFTPPPIPDDRNLAAIPLLKMESIVGDRGIYPVALRKAMRTNLPGNELPPRGNWMRSELPDMIRIRDTIASNYSIAFKIAPFPSDTLVQFDGLYPFLQDLRASAATRPLCRFDLDYTTMPPANRMFGLLTDQLRLSQILTLHAVLALNHHQSDLALEDIKTNYQLLSGVTNNPTIVAGLVAIGINAVASSAIYDGLAQHAWNDAQLAKMDGTLGSIDFLTDYRFEMRAEAVESVANTDYFKTKRPNLVGWLTGMSGDETASEPIIQQISIRLSQIFPGGWWDQNKCQMAALIFNALPSVDPKTQRVFPGKVNELKKAVQHLSKRSDAYAPWNFLFTEECAWTPAQPARVAEGQVWVDETRIACALERYHLAHGVYPASLDELVPACIAAVPHDIMNGQPYHYQLRPDGTFLLYSVGWNQTDDGGLAIYTDSNHHPSQDYEHGDWVWPTPKWPVRDGRKVP